MKTPLLIALLMLSACSVHRSRELEIFAVANEAAARTDLYSIEPDSSKCSLIFSDAGSPIRLLYRYGSGGDPGHVIVAGGNRILAYCYEKGSTRKHETESDKFNNSAIFEISTDGSGRCRKVCNVESESPPVGIYVNSRGTKVAYQSYLRNSQHIFVHDTDSGNRLNDIDVTNIFPDYIIYRVGWLASSDSITFTIDEGPEEEQPAHPGTFIVSSDGSHLTKLPGTLTEFLVGQPHYSHFPATEYIGASEVGYHFIHVGADSRPSGPGNCVLSFNLSSAIEDVNRISIPNLEYVGGTDVSQSGRWVALLHEPYIPNTMFRSTIWLKDLHSKGERPVYSISADSCAWCHVALVGWIRASY